LRSKTQRYCHTNILPQRSDCLDILSSHRCNLTGGLNSLTKTFAHYTFIIFYLFPLLSIIRLYL